MSVMPRASTASIVASLAAAVLPATPLRAQLPPDSARALAREAYVWAAPMLDNYRTMVGSLAAAPAAGGAAFNQFRHVARLLGPADRAVVAPNTDTPYSTAWLDLAAEPVMLCAPSVPAPRYFTLQLIDFNTHVVGYVGSRATGRRAGCHLVAHAGWRGTPPRGVHRGVSVETRFVLVLGRVQADGPDDLPVALAVQRGFTVQTLSAFRRRAPRPAAPLPDLPTWSETEAAGPGFIRYVNTFLPWLTPSASERRMLRALEAIGIGDGHASGAGRLSPELRAAVAAGVEDARQAIGARVRSLGTRVNGWASADAFGDRGFYEGDWLLRASAARAGLYGNVREEALYLGAGTDADGQPLDGRRRYEIRFPAGQRPPADAFWSITLYGADLFLTPNPLDRYRLGSADSLRVEPDGSVVLLVGHDAPGAERRANWLPAPEGPFRLILRLYVPTPAASDGRWKPPAVRRVDAWPERAARGAGPLGRRVPLGGG
jgi:hypothetical protein